MFSIATISASGMYGSVNDVVAFLQAELDELLQEKARIRLRMRNLRRRLASSKRGQAARRERRRLRNAGRQTAVLFAAPVADGMNVFR